MGRARPGTPATGPHDGRERGQAPHPAAPAGLPVQRGRGARPLPSAPAALRAGRQRMRCCAEGACERDCGRAAHDTRAAPVVNGVGGDPSPDSPASAPLAGWRSTQHLWHGAAEQQPDGRVASWVCAKLTIPTLARCTHTYLEPCGVGLRRALPRPRGAGGPAGLAADQQRVPGQQQHGALPRPPGQAAQRHRRAHPVRPRRREELASCRAGAH